MSTSQFQSKKTQNETLNHLLYLCFKLGIFVCLLHGISDIIVISSQQRENGVM